MLIGTRLEPTKCLLAYYPDVVRIPSWSGRLLLHTVVDQDQPNLGCVRLIARYFIVTTTKLYVYIWHLIVLKHHQRSYPDAVFISSNQSSSDSPFQIATQRNVVILFIYRNFMIC